MPDEHPLTLRRVDQSRTDFAIIEDELEAIHARLARLPTCGRIWAGDAADHVRSGGAGATEVTLSPLCPAHYHVDLTAAAPGADQLSAPVENSDLGAVAACMITGVGLDLMPAISAPDDQPHAGRSGVAQRHRRAELRLHERSTSASMVAMTASWSRRDGIFGL